MTPPEEQVWPQVREPRWQVFVAVLVMGGIFLALPTPMTPGPNWLLLAVLAPLAVAASITNRLRRVDWAHRIGFVVSSVMTVALVWSLARLIVSLPKHTESAVALLRSAAALWASNILVFATWYWRLDAGGPHQRDLGAHHKTGAFLFPQMTLGKRYDKGWTPGFVDYLFLAFNTSTAFSPTDVAPLSRWAKILMMLQGLLSLMIIAILAGRAVNIL